MWSFWHSKDFEFTGLWVIVFERFMRYMDTQSIQVQSTFSPEFHNTDPVSNWKDSIAVEHMIDLRAHIHAERITLRTRLCKPWSPPWWETVRIWGGNFVYHSGGFQQAEYPRRQNCSSHIHPDQGKFAGHFHLYSLRNHLVCLSFLSLLCQSAVGREKN